MVGYVGYGKHKGVSDQVSGFPRLELVCVVQVAQVRIGVHPSEIVVPKADTFGLVADDQRVGGGPVGGEGHLGERVCQGGVGVRHFGWLSQRSPLTDILIPGGCLFFSGPLA